jgi:hypothetical protein
LIPPCIHNCQDVKKNQNKKEETYAYETCHSSTEPGNKITTAQFLLFSNVALLPGNG